MTALLAAGCALVGLLTGRLLTGRLLGRAGWLPGRKPTGDRRGRDAGRPAGRYPALELLTAAVFAALAVRLGPDAALPAFLYLGGVGVALARIDLVAHRLPNALTVPSYGVGAVLLAAAAVSKGTAAPLVRGLLGMAALFGFYFLLAFLHPAGMGFGDVKLAGVIGLYLGWLGWGAWAVGALAAFLLGGLAGVALVAAGRAGLRTAIPFGPFMLVGCLLGVLAGEPLAASAAGG